MGLGRAPAVDQDVQPDGLPSTSTPTVPRRAQNYMRGQPVNFAASDPRSATVRTRSPAAGPSYPQYGYSYLPTPPAGRPSCTTSPWPGTCHQPAAVRPHADEDLHRPDHPLVRPGDHQGLRLDAARRADRPRHPLGRLGRHPAFHRLDELGPDAVERLLRAVHPGINALRRDRVYPLFGNAKAENSSTASANYVTASSGEGAINYDEYSYALKSGLPGGQAAEPGRLLRAADRPNDAVALTKAQINNDPAASTTSAEPRGRLPQHRPAHYPLSSYSYLIVPRDDRPGAAAEFHRPKAGRSARRRITSCAAGQKEMAALGYSPLPINLVRGGPARSTRSSAPCRLPTSIAWRVRQPDLPERQEHAARHRAVPDQCDKIGTPLYGCTTRSAGSRGDGTSTSRTRERHRPPATGNGGGRHG